MEFFPVILETFGAYHPKSLDTIKILCSQLASQLGADKGDITRHCLQKLSIVLQKGNCAHFTSRIPVYVHPEVDGDVDFD